MPHIPGPWRVQPDPFQDGTPYFHIIAGEGFYGDGEGHGVAVAAVMSEGNARLIAAAPDLLDALKAMLALWQERLAVSDRTGFPLPSGVHQARAAIAKAEWL